LRVVACEVALGRHVAWSRVWGLGFGVEGSGYRVWGARCTDAAWWSMLRTYHKPSRLDNFAILKCRICLVSKPWRACYNLRRPLFWCKINVWRESGIGPSARVGGVSYASRFSVCRVCQSKHVFGLLTESNLDSRTPGVGDRPNPRYNPISHKKFLGPYRRARGTNQRLNFFGGAVLRCFSLRVSWEPLPSEFGRNKTVKARFWPWLEPFYKPDSGLGLSHFPGLIHFPRRWCLLVRQRTVSGM